MLRAMNMNKKIPLELSAVTGKLCLKDFVPVVQNFGSIYASAAV